MLFLVLVSCALGALAVSTECLVARQSITTLSSNQVAAFRPYSLFAAAAYCPSSQTSSWSCGTSCSNSLTSDFKPVATGGDGIVIQLWYVGYSPSLKTVIVAHQGTNTTSIIDDLEDGNIVQQPLGSTLFPGVSSSIQVHAGFADNQAATGSAVIAAVQQALSASGLTTVTVIGHSLGGAIALLDSVMLPLHISGVTVNTITYGQPRVGNQAFADYVDAHLNLTHINNREDIVPILPGRSLGYHHSSGEVHIQDSGAWDACPGQDNPSALCIVGDVPTIFNGNETDHDGPYDGVKMGGSSCT